MLIWSARWSCDTPGTADRRIRRAGRAADARRPARPGDLVGGGWLACLGYAPGTTQPGVLRLAAALAAGRGLVVRVARPATAGRPPNAAALGDWRRARGRTPDEPDRTEPLVRDPVPHPGAAGADPGPLSGRGRGGDRPDPPRRLLPAEPLPAAARPGRAGRRRRSSPRRRPGCSRRTPALVSGPLTEAGPPDGDQLQPGAVPAGPRPRVTTAPIKGTAPRGPRRVERGDLRASAKDAAENVMIVDLMRNDLSRVCRPGTVTVDGAARRAAAPRRLAPGLHGARRAGRRGRHRRPAAGRPSRPGRSPERPSWRPRQGIAELEPESRGAYTGSLGLVSPRGRHRPERDHPHLRD